MHKLKENHLKEIFNRIFSRINVIVLGIIVGLFLTMEHRNKIYIISDDILVKNTHIEKTLGEIEAISISKNDFNKEKGNFDKFTKIAIAQSANLDEDEMLSLIKKHPDQQNLIRTLNNITCEYVDYSEIDISINIDYIFVVDMLKQDKMHQCLAKLKTRITSYFIFDFPVW